MNVEELQQWLKERDEAILSFDVEKFKEFYLKHQKLGTYKEGPLPDNRVIEISMYQSALLLSKATPEQREKARKWLAEHKYNPYPWGDAE